MSCDGATRVRRRTIGALLLIVSAVGATLLLLRPWAVCADDETSGACPVLEDHAAVDAGAWLAVALTGIAGGAVLTFPASGGGRGVLRR